MTARADPLADELALGWGEDTIYCEATCDPEDILYEGSDDEKYDSPEERKRRYEAAGQRFLDGKTPLLLTALLKGPFESKSTGWLNPWRSKHQDGTKRTRTSPGKLARSAKIRRNIPIPETVQPNSLECHLPSPESLNPSEVEAHPYLEEDELAKVQQWRDSVQTENERDDQKDQFWASTPNGTASERKRKAKGSSWLKLLANKRRRTDIMDSGSVDTPVPSRSQAPTSFANALNTSFSSVPDRLPSSAIAAGRYFGATQDDPVPSEDELARNKIVAEQAAADSSSPLSNLQYTPVPVANLNSSPQGSVEQPTPSQLPKSRRSSLPRNPAAESLDRGYNDTATPNPAFETQEDESFCFKMRSKFNQIAEDTPEEEDVLMTRADEETWSGISPDENVHSVVSDLKDDTPVEEQNDVQNPGSARVLDQCAVTSPLSSIYSENFDGFDLIGESPVDVRHSASNSSLIMETASNSHHNSTRAAMDASTIEQPIEPQQDAGLDNMDMDETVGIVSSLTAPESLTASETGSTAGSDDEEDEEDEENEVEDEVEDDKMESAKALSLSATSTDKTPRPFTVPREAETTPTKCTIAKLGSGNSTPSRAEFLLKASVKKRFISQASWKNLANLAGSPGEQTPLKTNRSSPGHLSSPASGREIRSQARSIHSTPKTLKVTQTPKFSQPSNHDASLVQDHSVHEHHLVQEPGQSTPKANTQVSLSQQSPWAAHKLSQHATLSLSQKLTESPRSDANKIGNAETTNSPVKQTPWTGETHELSIEPLVPKSTVQLGNQTASLESNTPVLQFEAGIHVHDMSALATPGTASTTEPQFSLKSFASFRSPSEPSSQQSKRALWRESGSRLPSTQGILASATKNPWETKTSERRVAFAPLPDETGGHLSAPTTPCPSLNKKRISSPPPDTLVSELPQSEVTELHEHLNNVARGPIIRRSNRLLPTESQCTAGSPLPDAMAEAFLVADQLRETTSLADPAKSDRETDDSQDPMDMAADVFRDSEVFRNWDDFSNQFNVDNAGQQSSPKVQGLQSPW
ncbi:uncharacterized protein FTOL_01052 [Fusarium torulosum]|uniref:Protamine P1 n=1 Tax=Fusarium torulosum TaxID=33205 RepID=A0AAE8SDI1_9HYPO|nr:uncharacterized protein FTOL_01052 [Fusarium torulosum]